MPYSTPEGRPWMLQRLAQVNPDSMLDIGCGSGTYSHLIHNHYPHAALIGIEVWEPYVQRFNLNDLYDELIVGDVREVDPLPNADVVILGDVLEHMTTDDAVKVWDRARMAARKAVYLSIPIVHYPQGECEGNPHEAHVVDDYTHQRILDTFPGITAQWTGREIGVYEAAA